MNWKESGRKRAWTNLATITVFGNKAMENHKNLQMVSRGFERATPQSVQSSVRNPLLAAGHWHTRSELPKGVSNVVGLKSRYTRQHALLHQLKSARYYISTVLSSKLLPFSGCFFPIRTLSVISGFRRDVDDNRALLGHYAVSGGNFLPTFRDNLSGPILSRNVGKKFPLLAAQ